MEIKELVKQSHQNAQNHGFWEDFDEVVKIEDKKLVYEFSNNAIGNRLMLITDEVAEAHEALRKEDMDNFKEELADIVIRVADLAGGLDVDLEAEILKKMARNKERPYKHGKAF